MIIECDSCRTKFRLDDSRITPGGVRVRCTKCQSVFIVKPPPSPDDVSVEEMFGVSTDSGRAPEPSSSTGAEEAEAGVTGGDEEAGWDEGADEEDFVAGLGAEGAEESGEADESEDTGEGDEERTPQAASGFEGLDFSFAMDKSDEEDGEGEEKPGPGGDETLDEGFGAGAESVADDAAGTGPAPAYDEDEGPSSTWDDEVPGTEGDDEGEGMGFDLGLDASAGDDRGAGDEDEEEDLHEGWNINIDFEEEGQDDELAESNERPSTEGFADDNEGTGEDETTGFVGDEEEKDFGAGGSAGDFATDESAEDAGLMGNALGDALEGLEDEEHAGVEEQLRELEKKVIPFNISTPSEQSAPAHEQEDEREEEEAGDLDWPTSTTEPEVPDAAAWLDEDRGGAAQDVASAAAAAGYSTASTTTTPESAPKPPSRAKAGLLLVLLAIIIIGGAGLYLSGAFESTGGGNAQTAEAVVDIELMKGYVVENKTFGNYFAVEAMVRNRTESPQQIKGARGVLFNSSGARIAERLTTPGRVLSAEDLRTMTAAELEKYFKDPTGGTIPAKGVIPVMVLFTDMPVGISEYGVDVIR